MIAVFGFIIGICLGSLTKAIADRSLTDKTFWGRSYCEACKKQLAWYDLFPVLSYLLLKGKCRYCKKKFSPEYLLIEVLTGLIVSWIFVKTVPLNILELDWTAWTVVGFSILMYSTIVVTLISTFITDFKTGYIPDRITFPAIWIMFLTLLVVTAFKSGLLYWSLSESALGKYLLPPASNYYFDQVLRLSEPLFYGCLMAFLIGLFFYVLIVITRGKGMGGGDLKLGVFLGLAFGFPYSLVVLMMSFLLGSIYGIGLIALGKKKFGQTLPFGPFMSIAGIIVIFWGSEILDWYLHLSF